MVDRRARPRVRAVAAALLDRELLEGGRGGAASCQDPGPSTQCVGTITPQLSPGPFRPRHWLAGHTEPLLAPPFLPTVLPTSLTAARSRCPQAVRVCWVRVAAATARSSFRPSPALAGSGRPSEPETSSVCHLWQRPFSVTIHLLGLQPFVCAGSRARGPSGGDDGGWSLCPPGLQPPVTLGS